MSDITQDNAAKKVVENRNTISKIDRLWYLIVGVVVYFLVKFVVGMPIFLALGKSLIGGILANLTPFLAGYFMYKDKTDGSSRLVGRSVLFASFLLFPIGGTFFFPSVNDSTLFLLGELYVLAWIFLIPGWIISSIATPRIQTKDVNNKKIF